MSTPTDTPNQLKSQRGNNWTATDHTTGRASYTESRAHSDYIGIEVVSGTTYGDENTGTDQLDKKGDIIDDNRRELKYGAFNRVIKVVR